MKDKFNFKKGDLVRMCTQTEAVNLNIAPEDIDWLYGIYVDSVVYHHSYDGFVDCAEEYDRVLWKGRVMEYDYFWYMERVS